MCTVNEVFYSVTIITMWLINTNDLWNSWPVKIWLRIFSSPETITIDNYRDDYAKKSYREKKYDDVPKMLHEYETKAQFYPEFSRLLWIAYAVNDWKVNTFAWSEETLLKTLNEFFKELDELAPRRNHILCWFNLYKHDVPYIWKRMIINWIKPDHHLRLATIPPYKINEYVYDVNQLRSQSSFSAELPLIVESVLWERADWDPYSAWNIVRALEKTRAVWNRICDIFRT